MLALGQLQLCAQPGSERNNGDPSVHSDCFRTNGRAWTGFYASSSIWGASAVISDLVQGVTDT